MKMKSIINKISFFTVLCSLLLASCKKDFQEINTDPNNTPVALPQQLMAPALVSTLTYNMIRNRNFNNELMQVTVDISDADGKVFRYDYRSNWADYLYNGLYSELSNFKDMYKVASEELNQNDSYKGISLICQSWIYSILTDAYGDVPYTESNRGRDDQIFEPKFDNQRDIYLDIFKQLDSANVLLSHNKGIVASGDPVFGGNISRWRKFGNSLYLRLLLRVSGKAEATAAASAKIKDIVETNAADYPIMTSNDESAILRWTGAGPYVSPYLSVREQDFRGVAISSYFIDNLVIWNDPRIDISQGNNGINRWAIATYQGAFSGVPSGYTPGTVPTKKSYFYSTSSTSTLMTEPLTGWISSSAETYYNDGILNSIKLWLPNWSVPIATYIAAADIAWNNAATLDEKMEKIHLQKYYALFLTDMQQWFEYRRTGHPVLPMGPGLKNNGVMPARLTYPVYVQSTNPTNYQAAVAAQGPDVISTQVWWQKP